MNASPRCRDLTVDVNVVVIVVIDVVVVVENSYAVDVDVAVAQLLLLFSNSWNHFTSNKTGFKIGPVKTTGVDDDDTVGWTNSTKIYKLVIYRLVNLRT